MPIFASASRAAVSKASPAMNSETVKPMPASVAMPAIWRMVTPVGSVATRSLVATKIAPVMPIELAEEQAGDHADGDG